MRARVIFLLLAGLILGVAGGWYFGRRPGAGPTDVPPSARPMWPVTNAVKTHTVVRHVNFTWEEVESADYVTYINNLRAIGCPEQTIRDIIVADVNQLYLHRRVTEVISADQQWWRAEPEAKLVEEAMAKVKSLEAERIALLTKLLGPGWDADSNAMPPANTSISLTGPVLGDIPPATKQVVYDIAMRAEKRAAAYIESQRVLNKPVDPVELARMREESRRALAAVLNGQQMEEFLLRYSSNASDLRQKMRGLDTTPDEFRKIFFARDAIMSQQEYNYAGDDPTLIKTRDLLHAQAEDAMKQAMGSDKYTAYQLNQDPIFRSSKSTVETLGAPPAAVQPIYEINRLTNEEMNRIRADDTMSNEEKVEALAATQVEQQKTLERILGPEAFQRWLTNKVQ